MRKVLLAIILLIIPFFVYADECDTSSISIKSISLANNTDGVVEKSDPVINGDSITLDLLFLNYILLYQLLRRHLLECTHLLICHQP